MVCFAILVLPDGCLSYLPPHEKDCMRTVWKKAGCLSEGHGYVDNLTLVDMSIFNEMNIS